MWHDRAAFGRDAGPEHRAGRGPDARREQLATRRTVTGELLPAHLPATAAALAAGAIGTGQLHVITQAMAALPSTVSADDRDWAEALHGTAFRGLIEQLVAPRPLTEDIPDRASHRSPAQR
ncbi:MAG: DUF222 domain-containing protein [Pseudonocardiaceae bacterium]